MNNRFCVVGNPIGHSLSPQIHQLFAAQFQTDIDYQKKQLKEAEFGAYFDNFFAHGGCGANVTVPFKTHAYAYVTQHDESAKLAQAVNTMHKVGAQIIGYNTDGVGLVQDIVHRHQQTLHNTTVLILGAGGATQGIIGPLLAQSPAQIVIANRTVAKASSLVAQFEAITQHQGQLTCCELQAIEVQAQVIINATSLGLQSNAQHIEQFWPTLELAESFCYDMSYGVNAAFQRWCEARGAAASVDGLGMLVDNAVVIMENIDRFQKKGYDGRVAAILASFQEFGSSKKTSIRYIKTLTQRLANIAALVPNRTQRKRHWGQRTQREYNRPCEN